MDSASESDRKRLILSARELLDKTTLLIVNNSEVDDDVQSKLEKLRAITLNYCKSDSDWKVENDILKEMQQVVSDPDSTENFNFDEMYEKLRTQKLKKTKNKDFKNHEWYKEFEEKLNTIHNKSTENEEEEELVTTETVKSYTDPFTKQVMQNPMKNTRCGHSYDRVAVISMLKKKKKLRCPFPLCDAMVVERDLEENTELLNEIRQSQNV